MTTTKTTDTRTATTATVDPIDVVIADAENDLATKLASAGPLEASEAPALLAQFRRTATALRLALVRRPVPAGLTDDVTVFTTNFVRAQLAKETAALVANAEARANRAQRDADEIWRAHVDNEQRNQRWARARQGGPR